LLPFIKEMKIPITSLVTQAGIFCSLILVIID
jgi:hypothetical protein